MGSMKCDSSAPCIPTIFQRQSLSLHDIVRSRSPRRMPSQVWVVKSGSMGIVPSPEIQKPTKKNVKECVFLSNYPDGIVENY